MPRNSQASAFFTPFFSLFFCSGPDVPSQGGLSTTYFEGKQQAMADGDLSSAVPGFSAALTSDFISQLQSDFEGDAKLRLAR